MKTFVLFALLQGSAVAGPADFGYLKTEDQKYFKNDSMDGNNVRDRVDLNVKEINRLHGEVATLKAELAQLRADLEELKKKK